MALDANDLADAMQSALPQAWTDVKGEAFPGDPNDPDQRVMFLAIARGLLSHLLDRQASIVETLDVSVGGGATVTEQVSNMTLNITGV